VVPSIFITSRQAPRPTSTVLIHTEAVNLIHHCEEEEEKEKTKTAQYNTRQHNKPFFSHSNTMNSDIGSFHSFVPIRADYDDDNDYDCENSSVASVLSLSSASSLFAVGPSSGNRMKEDHHQQQQQRSTGAGDEVDVDVDALDVFAVAETDTTITHGATDTTTITPASAVSTPSRRVSDGGTHTEAKQNTNPASRRVTATATATLVALPSSSSSVSSSSHNINPKDVDVLLTKELQQLSFQDRTTIQEEIHGVTTICPPKTYLQQVEALHQLQKELDALIYNSKHHTTSSLSSSLSSAQRDAYLEAISSTQSYVHQTAFRLRFLRCELYNIPSAAIRLIKYIHLTKDTFGKEAITRPQPLQYSMLPSNVQDVFQMGHIQTLPYRDRSGRTVIITVFIHALHIPYSIRVRTYPSSLSCVTIVVAVVVVCSSRDIYHACFVVLILFTPHIHPLPPKHMDFARSVDTYIYLSIYECMVDQGSSIFIPKGQRRYRNTKERCSIGFLGLWTKW
jgi:hypothetical protein